MTQVVRDRLQQVVCLLFVATFAMTFSASAAAQQNPKPLGQRQFRENVTLPLDGNLRKRFSAVEELLSDRRWTEAISILEEIIQTDGKGLVEVQPGTVGGYATYLNVTTRCTILLSQVSPEGLQNYRQKIDPQAKRWFENWLRTRDETELQKIVRLAFLSRYGDDALIALGESAWDRGDFSAARLWWEQLIPLPDDANPADYPTVLRYPDAEIDKPTVLARIAFCSILERDPVRAEFVVRKFATDYPNAEGWLAGRRGRLADCLIQELDKSRQWQAANLDAEFETFGQSPARFRRIPDSIDVGSLRWVHPLSPNLLPHPVEGFPFQNEPLGYHPVIYDKIVLVNDADCVRAWNVLTGEPAWPSDRTDPAVIYPTVAEEASSVSLRMCIGVPEYTMAISEGRLFARMGSPISAVSNQPQSELESDLICLDLNQEGKLLWKIPARKLLNDGSWRFEGTPVVVSGKAFVTLCRRRPQLELTVVCLDCADGRLLWQQPIGGFRVSVGDSYNRVSHLLMTAGGGRLYLSTDLGLIISLNSVDGRFEWALTYETRTDESPAILSDPQQKGIRPAMFFKGKLIVAPNDSDYALCIETDTGRMKWRYPYLNPSAKELPDLLRREQDSSQRRDNQWRHLLGVAPGGQAGRLIASGKSLVAIDLESGHKIWQTPRAAFGRGVLAGDQVLLPGRSTIEICSQQTGQLIRTISLKTPDNSQLGGNLTIASGMLLVAQPNRIAAYSEFSQLKERIEQELTRYPDSSSLLIQLGDLEVAEGFVESAKVPFEKVVERANRNDPHYDVARKKLAKLFDEAGKTCFEKNNIQEAVNQWQRSLLIMDNPSKRVELLFNLSRAEESLQHFDVALERLQSIITDERLKMLSFGLLNAGTEATGRMSRIISEHSREPYARIEAVAARELEQLGSNATTGELKQFIEKYPHSRAVKDARPILADLYRRMDYRPEAYAVFEEIRMNASDESTLVQSTLALLELLGDSQNTRSVDRLWKDLEKCETATNVMFEGTPQSLENVLLKRKTSNKSVASQPRDIEQTWVRILPDGARVIFPENAPPTPEDLSVLVCSKHDRVPNAWLWRCYAWQTGQLRWEDAATSPIQTVRWTPVHLLIGGPGGWQARSAVDGRRVWGQSASEGSSATFAIQSTENGDDFAWPVLFHPEDGFFLFDPNDGKMVSRFKPPGRMNDVFAIGSPMRLGFRTNGVPADLRDVAADIDTLPLRSRSDQTILVMFQTMKPLRTWIASTVNFRTPWSTREISHGNETWKTQPFSLENWIIGITSDQHLIGSDIAASNREPKTSGNGSIIPGMDSNPEIVEFLRQPNLGGDMGDFQQRSRDLFHLNPQLMPQATVAGKQKKQWAFRNFATGQASPIAWAQKGHLLALNDGSRLISFNPENGQRKWTAGLVDFPMQLPAVQTCSNNDSIYATSQGRLRGIDIHTGKIQFETYLGNSMPQWRTSVAWRSVPIHGLKETGSKSAADHDEALLAIWPIGVADDSTIWLCDARQGELVQRLQVDSEPRKLVIDPGGSGVVWTRKSLSGLQTRAF